MKNREEKKLPRFHVLFRSSYLSVLHWQFLVTYIFSLSLKFGACYITSQWGELRVKNAILSLQVLFLVFWLLFFIKEFVFLSFSFLFLIKYQVCATEFNQSETGTDDKNFSVELLDFEI